MSPTEGWRSRWFNYLFYIRFVLATAGYCLAVGLPHMVRLPFLGGSARRRVWAGLIRSYGKFIIPASGRPWIRVEYADLAPEETASGVAVGNHRSGADAFMFGLWPTDLVQIAGEWPFRLPFFGRLARWGGYYNIRRMAFEDFLSRAVRDIREERISVVGFPEGTRSHGREMGPFHGTLFRLALAAECPVYPFLILGAEKVVDRRFAVRPGTIRLYKLPAVPPERFRDWSPFQLKNYVRDLMAAKIAELEKAEAEQR